MKSCGLRLATLAILLSGCQAPPGEEQASGTRAPLFDPMTRPSEDRGPLDLAPPAYRFGPRDQVEVRVRDHDEFGGEFEVERDGALLIPVIDRRLHVSGMTEPQVEEAVSRAVAAYVVGEPAVRVRLRGARSKFFYAFGAVAAQGRHPMSDEVLDLRDAILAVGNFAPSAAVRRVHLIRPDPEEPTYVVVDGRELLLGLTGLNVALEPGDIIYVPTTYYSLVNEVLGTVLGQLNRGIGADATYQYIEARLAQGPAAAGVGR
ncbi:MAG: polysaccharide biosynthesis/export family protein [Planctomycetes bacterium]|nr:polysaccharide biosynthesis/export family protein [Planctomycetota bacterium]